VSSDKVTGGQSTAKRKLSSKNSGTDNASKTAGVVTLVSGVRAANTKHVKHGALRLEDCTTTKGSDLKRGHRDGDLESTFEAAKG